MQTVSDERQIGVANDHRLAIGIAVIIGLGLAIWIWQALTRGETPYRAVLIAGTIGAVAASYCFTTALIINGKFKGANKLFLSAFALAIWTVCGHAILARIGLTQSLLQDLVNFIGLGVLTGLAQAATTGVRASLALRQEQQRRREAELRALSAQLMPHTLFNLLNTVYAAVLKDQAKGAELLLSLSDMLRHLTQTVDRPRISALAELEFMSNWAQLALAQAAPTSQIQLSQDGDLDTPVPPLLCATLFENALKHGRLQDGSLNIVAHFQLSEDGFEFKIENAVPPVATEALRKGGSGLANLRSRLNLLYPLGHMLSLNQRDGRHFALLRVRFP